MQPNEPTQQPEQPTPSTPPENPAPTQPTVTGPTVTQAPTQVPSSASNHSTIVTGSSYAAPRKRFSLALIAVLVLALLGGGGAAAYFGVVVPNKPENILKAAVSNTLKQKKTKFDGKLSFESTEKSASIKAVNVTINGQADLEANALQSNIEVTASGVNVPLEVRSLDKTLYLKLGSLKSLSALTAGSPEYAAYVNEIAKRVENQWLEIDETLLKQMESECVLDVSYNLTQEDINLILNQYKNHPFGTIKSKSSEKVGDRNAIKFEIAIDGKKSVEYADSLSELSIVKKLKECDKSGVSTKTEDTENGVITLWVDKSTKTVIKIATQTTPEQEAKEKAKASLEVTFRYGQAEVTKPEGAKPIMEVFGDLNGVLGARDTVVPAVLGTNSSR